MILDHCMRILVGESLFLYIMMIHAEFYSSETQLIIETLLKNNSLVVYEILQEIYHVPLIVIKYSIKLSHLLLVKFFLRITLPFPIHLTFSKFHIM